MPAAGPVLTGILAATAVTGAVNGDFFIDPASCNLFQLAFLAFVYGYVLLIASNQISDGTK